VLGTSTPTAQDILAVLEDEELKHQTVGLYSVTVVPQNKLEIINAFIAAVLERVRGKAKGDE